MSLVGYVKIHGEGPWDSCVRMIIRLTLWPSFLNLLWFWPFFAFFVKWYNLALWYVLQGSLDGARVWTVSLVISGHTPHSPGCVSLPWEVSPALPLLRMRGWLWVDNAVPAVTAPPTGGSCDRWGQWRDVPVRRIGRCGALLVRHQHETCCKRGHIRVELTWTGCRATGTENFNTTSKIIDKGIMTQLGSLNCITCWHLTSLNQIFRGEWQVCHTHSPSSNCQALEKALLVNPLLIWWWFLGWLSWWFWLIVDPSRCCWPLCRLLVCEFVLLS